MSKISVVMSVNNGKEFLKMAIESVLKQKFSDFEFLIIDDGAKYFIKNILKKYQQADKRIKIISNRKRLGLTKSLNKAIRIAQGDYLARMDADDICFTERLTKQLAFMEMNRKVAFCGTGAVLIDKNNEEIGQKIHPSKDKEIRKVILSYCPFIHPTLMFRRQVLIKSGLYNENFTFAQDYELVLRIMSQYKAANLKEPLLYYRVGEEKSISLSKLKQQEVMALKARWLALTRYGYAKGEFWKLLKPLLSFLLPATIKIPIYKKFYWRK